MSGRIIQVSVSKGGLPKLPVFEGFCGPLGIEGDRQAHPRIHGGPEKAILLIGMEIVEELGLFAGAVGENLTTEGLDFRALRSGDRLRVGEAEIQLTALRVPCKQLAVYRKTLPDEIRGIGGFYARVLLEGVVRAGDLVEVVRDVGL